MTNPLTLTISRERAYQRKLLFAVELLDPLTLERVSHGVKVTTKGLDGRPVVNTSGCFVWHGSTPAAFDALQEVAFDLNSLPYESVARVRAGLSRPLTSIELSPRVDYSFPPGVTALRGSLIEARVTNADVPVPVAKADVRLLWLADDPAVWHEGPVVSHTTEKGDFALGLRLAPGDVPMVVDGKLRLRVRVRREGESPRESADLALAAGRTHVRTDFPRVSDPLVFAWDELAA